MPPLGIRQMGPSQGPQNRPILGPYLGPLLARGRPAGTPFERHLKGIWALGPPGGLKKGVQKGLF